MRQHRPQFTGDGVAGHLLQPGTQHPQMLLGLLALAEIADDAGEIQLAVVQLAHGNIRRKQTAVLAPPDDFPAFADDVGFAGAQITLEITTMPLLMGRRHEQADILPQQFLWRITEQPGRGRIDRLDDAVPVNGDHGIGDGSKYGLQA